MTDEQSEENFETKTTWTTIVIDSEITTATKIPTARGQAMAKGMGVYRRKGQTLRQLWKQMMMMEEVEEMAKLVTEQASDFIFVGMPRAEGFSKGVKLRCEAKVAECVTTWSQEKASGQGRENELHMPREGPCPRETELKECRDKIKKRNIPKTGKLVKWEELRIGHLLKQVSLLAI